MALTHRDAAAAAQQRGFRLAVGQVDCRLGDLSANLARVEQICADAVERGCDFIVFPELVLSGYAVGPGFSAASLSPDSPEVGRLTELSRRIGVALGFIEETEDAEFYNSAICLHGGRLLHVHRKVYLPNYRMFDERRYFGAGHSLSAFGTPWCRMAMLICGDMWHLPMAYLAAHDGADVLLVLAASSDQGLTPAISVRSAWERMNRSAALTLSNFVVFANRVGQEQLRDGGESLAFWGGSHVCGPDGELIAQAGQQEELLVADLDFSALRRQRLVLPFRRDDSLGFTLETGRRIARAKTQRRDGFQSLLSVPGTNDWPAAAPAPAVTPRRP